MAHNHGNEYQIRFGREDGIEELSGWMHGTEQVAQAMLAIHRPQGRTYWLLVRIWNQSSRPGVDQRVAANSTVSMRGAG